MNTAPRNKFAYFEPEVELALRHLLQYTMRTATIFSLLATPAKDRERLTNGIIRLIDDLYGPGVAERRPRGNSCQYDSRSFLDSAHDRHDASLLLALHRSGPEGLGARTPHLVDGQYHSILQRIYGLTSVYSEYVRITAPGEAKGRIAFDAYLELLNAVRDQAVETATCNCCGARHVYNPLNVVNKPSCPFCVRLVNIGKARAELELRLQQRRAADRPQLNSHR